MHSLRQFALRRRMDLVAPGLSIGTCGSGREHVIDHDGKDALQPVGVVLLHGVLAGPAGVAVRHAGAVLEDVASECGFCVA